MSNNAIQISGLTKRHSFETLPILDNISMDIPSGRITLIIGQNGCGKSTLLNCISGIIPFEQGEIKVNIKDQVNYTLNGGSKSFIEIESRKKVGVIFQQKGLWPHLTVYDNISHPLRKVHKNLPEAIIRERVEEYIERIGLRKDQLKKYPLELSGGQQRKAAIARTLAIKPELLIVDELEANLDQSSLDVALSIIDEDFLRKDKTVLMITHRAELIDKFAPNILVLYPDGPKEERVISADGFDQLFKQYYSSENTLKYIKNVVDPVRSQWYFGNQCLETATKISSLNLNRTDEKQLLLDLGTEVSKLISKLESDESHLLLIATKSAQQQIVDFKIRSAEITPNYSLNGKDVYKLRTICEGKEFATDGHPVTYKMKDDYKSIIRDRNGISLEDGKIGAKDYNGLIDLMFERGWRSWIYKNNDHSEELFGAINITIPVDANLLIQMHSYNEYSKDTNNVYLIAIRIGDEVKGVISIDTTSKKKWSNFVMEQLILIANITAIAIKQGEELENIKATISK